MRGPLAWHRAQSGQQQIASRSMAGPAGRTEFISLFLSFFPLSLSLSHTHTLSLSLSLLSPSPLSLDVAGVLDKNGELLSELALDQIEELIKDGTINGGMIPKIESCKSVVKGGVEGVIILDGRQPHAVLLELFTPHGVGTRIS